MAERVQNQSAFRTTSGTEKSFLSFSVSLSPFTSARWHKRRETNLSLSHLPSPLSFLFLFLANINKSHLPSFPSTPFATSKRSRENRYLYLLIANSRDSSSFFPASFYFSPYPPSLAYPPSIPRSSGIPKHLDLLNAKCFRQTMLNRDVAPRCNPRCYRCRREEREGEKRTRGEKRKEERTKGDERSRDEEERIGGSLVLSR